jgi:hypothetical protein
MIGEKLGQYRLSAKIGEGGMSRPFSGE